MAMGIQEFSELMVEINDKHGWNKLWENSEAGRKTVKYVRTSFDTRDGKDGENGELWAVKLTLADITGSKIKGESALSEFVFQEDECTKDNILSFLRNKGCIHRECSQESNAYGLRFG